MKKAYNLTEGDIMAFEKTDVRSIDFNPVTMFADNWALLSGKVGDKYNSMTVSWGALGELWGKDVLICFVRPQRYTYEFTENGEYFSLSFFKSECKKELSVFGHKSGRDTDKYKETGFTPVVDGEFEYCVEEDFVFLCRKIAFQDMNPDGFIDKSIENNYANKDYHRTYVGEILSVLKKV